MAPVKDGGGQVNAIAAAAVAAEACRQRAGLARTAGAATAAAAHITATQQTDNLLKHWEQEETTEEAVIIV